MDIEKLKRSELREVIISVRTYPSYSKFLKEHDISPSKLFNEAIKELMENSQPKGGRKNGNGNTKRNL